ncbi:MAG: archaeosortase A [Candidatus Thermoplasmatota archaeon]
MESIRKRSADKQSVLYFLVLPTLLILFGYLFYPYPAPETVDILIYIPLFLGLILLSIGFIRSFLKQKNTGSTFKIYGWIIFAFFWSTQPKSLYFGEGGDVFNATVCIIGVYVLFYLAYQEWISIKKDDYIGCLNWIAGASAIAGLIYFGVEKTPLGPFLIEIVANQSSLLLNSIIGDVSVEGTNIFYKGRYVVSIIFACTAMQSMVLFIGMIGALEKVDIKRKLIGGFITVVPIYLLNLLRNALVGFLLAKNIADFNLAHNVIAKIGSLIALIIILYGLTKVIPEIFDEIICLTDLYKRDGPLERFIKKHFLGEK